MSLIIVTFDLLSFPLGPRPGEHSAFGVSHFFHRLIHRPPP
jgi:hypothetical protein